MNAIRQASAAATRFTASALVMISGLFATLFLGGSSGHADELEAGMQATLDRLKAAVEG